MQDRIKLAKPSFTESELAKVSEVLRSGQLISGPIVKEFENAFSSFASNDAKCLAVNSGTSALFMAMQLSGIPKGKGIIVPAFSYIATANVVELAGYKPIFCDVDLRTCNIDLEKLAGAGNAGGILVVHEFGNPADMDLVMASARQQGLVVLEDAACAMGTRINGQHVGSFGLASGFSFHPRKAITSGDGGLFMTREEETYFEAKRLLNHGVDRESKGGALISPGFNFRLTEFQAVLLLGQLQRFEEELKRRDQIASFYLQNINLEKFDLPQTQKGGKHSWQSFHLRVRKTDTRDSLIKSLRSKGIESSLGAQCIPNEKYYKEKYSIDPEREFPNALDLNQNGIVIPVHGFMTDLEVEKVVQMINNL